MSYGSGVACYIHGVIIALAQHVRAEAASGRVLFRDWHEESRGGDNLDERNR